MPEKIGVYVCECGPNIKAALDLEAVVRHAKRLQNVERVLQVGLLCSPEGISRLAHDIRANELTRVVFAGCSPKEHEHTFRKLLQNAGLNPFLLQVANIREQCAWVVHDKARATQKAKGIVTAAVERVAHHAPLDTREIECRTDVLVIGAGVAGISAAHCLAQENRKIYLVEKLPCIGGKVALYEGLTPDLACAACVIEPRLDSVLHNEQIKLMTLGEIVDVQGYYGNFLVRIKKSARLVDEVACIGCGACLDACPVEVRNAYNQGLDTRKAVYIPYPGALPNLAVIDNKACLRFKGETCSACREACPFGAIDYDAEDEIVEIQVGAVVVATGLDTFDPWSATRAEAKPAENMLTGTAFERMVNSSGPTGGKITLQDGSTPEKIVIVHCVGSRTERFNAYCSGVCCQNALKHAHQARQQLPQTMISAIYTDMCLPGLAAQRFFDQVSRNDRIRFIRSARPGEVKITREAGQFVIACQDARGNTEKIRADLVIMEAAIESAKDSRELADILEITRDRDGFFEAIDTVTSPVATLRKGIFIAGCAQGPKDIPASVAQGQAAASRILQELIPGKKLTLEPMIAEVDDDLCSGCLICKNACTFQAISSESSGMPVLINQALCRGCGVCAAACPSGAIAARHFTNDAIKSEIRGLLKP
ncbi:MAG: CoB--CoM heterodisulfide reductase iron-sulfur subunit A family protein [Desulfobacterales bacterium]|nr:CoB--CoM heterodisulfide reductase iron-sulfur subunit A family protein [Desulfobacterales bacterium]